jgi:hypothetical protein
MFEVHKKLLYRHGFFSKRKYDELFVGLLELAAVSVHRTLYAAIVKKSVLPHEQKREVDLPLFDCILGQEFGHS